VLTALRLQLALIPFLWSLWQQDTSSSTDDSDTRDAADTTGDTSGHGTADKTFTPEQFRRAVAREVADKRKQIEQELRAEQESKRLEEDKQWQDLAEKRKAESADLKLQLEAREAAERNRILRYEIRDAARDLAFADPDDAYHLIDRDSIEFDNDGEPTNVAKLVKALAERKPHLVKVDDAVRRGTPSGTRGNGSTSLTREQLIEQEIQAQRSGRIRVR